ncbi:succinylglutamate desuccinylase/aspartoacylase domain-containing protein [Fodinibius sediminis]|uniref:Succinylglutamate desuccinylase n=1 Tax=Fodinibius sediminis TaxID=1214077 RepID=A0A521ANA3_9BACT|nr:succinylglutamate desuccinylase/aspartoacylase family protein [Fodinibius sediminis]SMO36272.1 succinylglutamate desuccinylase [Fodinibius sediminis]
MKKQTIPEQKTIGEGRRVIGSLAGGREGPQVVLLAGMHGNEYIGVEAVGEVLDRLRGREDAFNGRLLALRANIRALEQKVRYVDEDMNRLWFPSIIREIRSTPEHRLSSSERREAKQLLRVLDQVEKKQNPHPTILADIHTFSAEGAMFTLPNLGSEQLDLLSGIYAPMVLGVGESLRGTALKYYHNRGLFSFALEGGQHENSLTRQNIVASLMVLLQQAGCIREGEEAPEMAGFREHLRAQTHHLPEQTELVYQHIIEEGDDFVMRPGFQNFQPVKEGQWLASDRYGRIKAQCDGYVLMPLYQAQGNDGFFIIKGRDEQEPARHH